MKMSIRWLVALAVVGGAAHAADPSTNDAAKAQYDAERARCMAGTTGQDQASCLKSAGAGYDSARQGRLQDPNGNFRDNVLARCKTLPPAERADCVSRIDGGTGTTTSGSVKGGGTVTETVTPIPPPPPLPK